MNRRFSFIECYFAVFLAIVTATPLATVIEHYTIDNLPPFTHDDQVFENGVCPHCKEPVQIPFEIERPAEWHVPVGEIPQTT